MITRKSYLAAGLTLAVLSLPFPAGAHQSSAKTAATTPIGIVAEAETITNYQMLLKSYDKELFHYGKAQLTAKGRNELNHLAAALHNIDYRIIDIAGHADPTESAHDNQQLAHQRAAAVKTYLATRGIHADRIFTDAQPIETFGKCVTTQGDALRKCLAPYRSADVKVLARAAIEESRIDQIFDHIAPAPIG